MVDYDETLYKILDDKATEEFKGVLEYDEIIEKMKGPEHEKHRRVLRNIQEDQSVHTLEIANIMDEMEMPEASVIQKLEDWFKIKEDIKEEIKL